MMLSAPTRTPNNTGVFEGLLRGLELPPKMVPSEWADAHFVLSPEGSAEPGRYNSKRAAYVPGMLDAIVEPGVKTATFKCSAQVSKTTILLIIIGYMACRRPAPTMFATANDNLVEQFSKERLAPAIRDVPEMARVFPAEGERSASNKLAHKKFPGGFLAMVSAQSPANMRARSIKFALADEVDAWEGNANKEGDPISGLVKRGTTFWDFRMIAASTPLEKYRSRISRLYDESDQRRFMVPCPHCEGQQALEWKLDKESNDGYRPKNIQWEPGKPETARYVCEHCGSLLDDIDLKQAVRKGYWQASMPFNGNAGFWIWELYSPWSSLYKIVKTYEYAVGFADRMMSFVNTTLGLEWEGEVVGTLEVRVLMARREELPRYVVPAAAGLLTAAVDVQADRLELMVIAWGIDDQRWILSVEQIPGDPNGPRVWALLQENLLRVYKHAANGREMGIEVCALDSGGWHTQKVYDFCAQHMLAGRLWFPIKGVSGFGKPIWKRSPMRLKGGIPLYLVGVDDAKTSVYASLAVREPGPNYVHLPMSMGEDNFKRLTVEKCLKTVDPKGFQKREWVKPEGARNEEFDLAVYNVAARSSLNVDMDARLASLSQPPEPPLDGAAIARMFKR